MSLRFSNDVSTEEKTKSPTLSFKDISSIVNLVQQETPSISEREEKDTQQAPTKIKYRQPEETKEKALNQEHQFDKEIFNSDEATIQTEMMLQ